MPEPQGDSLPQVVLKLFRYAGTPLDLATSMVTAYVQEQLQGGFKGP